MSEQGLPQDEPPIADLGDLHQEVTPPAALEGRIVKRLVSSGLLESDRGRPAIPLLARGALVAAALVVAFIVGRTSVPAFELDAGSRTSATGESTQTGRRYALLLYSGDSDEANGSERRAEYIAWARQTATDGRFVDGEELGPREVTVGTTGTEVLPSAPPPALAGFFVVQAADFDEAVALARDHPHVRHSGVIRVREVVTE